MNRLILAAIAVLLPLSVNADCKSVQCANGFGTYEFETAVYRGEFEGFQMSGTGTYSMSNGERYEGEFRNNQLTGRGTYYWPNGDRYEGEVDNGQLTGKGTFYSVGGDSWEGLFNKGKLSGLFKVNYSEGGEYIGEFTNGIASGQGMLKRANGDQYVGEFKDNLFHGQGTLTYLNGESVSGRWYEGDLAERKKTSFSSNQIASASVSQYAIELSHDNETFFINGKRYQARTYCADMRIGDPIIFAKGGVSVACSTAEVINLRTNRSCELWCE